EVDMTMAPMIQSYSRMQVGQYGPPIMYVQFGILSGSGVGTSNVFGYILTFDWKVWALILSAIPILALLMALSNWVRSKMTPKELAHEMHDNGWELFRNLLYESSPKDRTQIASRIVLTAWFMAVLVIANSFAGHLKSSMAIKNQPAQVDSVRDVAYAKGRLRPIVWKGSHYEAFLSTSRSPELSRVWQMVSQRNGSQLGKDMFRDEHMIQVLRRQAVLMVDHNSLQITWLYESGLVNKWMTDSLGDWQRCVRQGGGHSANNLTLKDTQASFVLWAMVLGLALVAFTAEMVVGSRIPKHPPVARPLPPKLHRRRMGTAHLRTAYGIAFCQAEGERDDPGSAGAQAECQSLGLGGRLAVVTGGASGIGRSVCMVLAREGATVVAADRNRTGSNETIEMLRQSYNGDHRAIYVDVSNSSSVSNLFEKIESSFPGRKVSVVVHSAGVLGTPGPIEETSDTDFDDVLATDLRGTFLINRASVRHMLANNVMDGTIVNIASDLATSGSAKLPSYSASKGGVGSLTKSVALEVAAKGIRVNAILPGPVDTPMLTNLPEEKVASFDKSAMFRRRARPEEISETIAFMCSPMSSFMTGAAVDVTG
ncbi:hypothetical protein HPB47_003676, partial [Ixodes persulcatus]